jgi:hypothetical protein
MKFHANDRGTALKPEFRPAPARAAAGRLVVRTRAAVVLSCFLISCYGCGRQEPEPTVELVPQREVRRIAPPPEFEEESEPAALATSPEPATLTRSELGRGIVYRNDRLREGPWSVNVLKIDRSRRDLVLTTTLGDGHKVGLSPLSDQVRSLSQDIGIPLAAVNGDFYRTEHETFAGDPRGIQIALGELISAPNNKSAFWIDDEGNASIGNLANRFGVIWPDGSRTPLGLNEERRSNDAVLYTPRVGVSTRARGGHEFVLAQHGDEPWLPLRVGQTYQAEVREVRRSGNSRIKPDGMVLSIGPTLLARVPDVAAGAVIQISTETSPSIAGAGVALGGGPVLLRGGKVQSAYSNKASERHPRSALGWNDQHFFFVQVDGRQHGFSVGMTLPELANYMARQGCQEAMNLDGGGSAEMWVEGRVVNRPCFGHERDTANALVVVRTQEVAAQ